MSDQESRRNGPMSFCSTQEMEKILDLNIEVVFLSSDKRWIQIRNEIVRFESSLKIEDAH